jgi:lysophospholipase L1-like esterase
MVRIAFQKGQGSWSAIGKDALDEGYFPKSDPTMNFGWLEDDTEDEEYRRVVVHEFGHALGCIHEHQSPNEHLDWDVEKVYEQFSGPPNNWSREEIDQNILQKYSPNGISATLFDPNSIMLYQFPAELFRDRKATKNNTDLSAKDEAFIRQMYPPHAGPVAALGGAGTPPGGGRPGSGSAAARLMDINHAIAGHRDALDAVRRGRRRLDMHHDAAAAAAHAMAPAGAAPGRRFKMVAQGDSWFNYWIGKDVLYWLNKDYGHDIHNIAVAGSTLNDEVYGPVPHDFLDFRQTDAPSRLEELVDVLQRERPRVLLLSAGGNDIAGDEFFSFVNNARSGLDAVNEGVLDSVISPTFRTAFETIIQKALDTADAAGFPMTVFTHGYDYPWPDGRGVLWIHGAIGPWFDDTFKSKNYPRDTFEQLKKRREIVGKFIDALFNMFDDLSKNKFKDRLFHIDTRRTLTAEANYRDEWANELHPTDDGFRKIAVKFNSVIQQKIP